MGEAVHWTPRQSPRPLTEGLAPGERVAHVAARAAPMRVVLASTVGLRLLALW